MTRERLINRITGDKMNRYVEKCNGKPSVAIRAMITGLREIPKSSNFVVDMNCFGRTDDKGVCYGCAATCTIQKLEGRIFDAEQVSAKKRWYPDGLIDHDTVDFEEVIDDLRRGSVRELFNLFNVPQDILSWVILSFELPPMDTGNYQWCLGTYEDLAKELEEKGY